MAQDQEMEEYEQIKKLLQTEGFILFLDKDLRTFAENCVQDVLKEGKVKKSQLHSIPAIVQAGGMEKLLELAKHQSEKQTRENNKKFWHYLKKILNPPDNCNFQTLSSLSLNFMRFNGINLPDPEDFTEKKEKKAVKKNNKQLIRYFVDSALPVFCEHFTCHYYYLVKEGQ